MSDYNKTILAYNIGESAKIQVYNLHYNNGFDELLLRSLTLKALEMDDEFVFLTADEHNQLESKMNEPYNN